MDSIWGDPWADNAKPDNPSPRKNESAEPEEVTAYEPAQPAADSFSAGFEDEAGWGDFEESTGLDINGVGGNGHQELQPSIGQGYDEELTRESASESHFRQTNGAGILSPGWGDARTFQSTPEPLPDNKHNDDTHSMPPSPTWESPRSSMSSIPSAPAHSNSKPIDHSLDRTFRSAKPDGQIVSEIPPSPSTSSTTKTVVSTDTDEFSDIPKSPVDRNVQIWTRKPSHSDGSRDIEKIGSLESLENLFDEADVASKYLTTPISQMKRAEELPNTAAGSLPNTALLDGEPKHVLTGEEQVDGDVRASPKTAQGPQFYTDLGLMKDLFNINTVSESDDQEVKDDLIDSTSTRKAWYRLTRSQTMREFNMGATDGSYVRASWPKSYVRTEALKIATRWASQDMINGRVVLGGKTGAAAFGWNMPDDGSVVPPRQITTANPTLFRKERENHDAPYQRQSSMPHASHRHTNASPVAQFGWSTSPTGKGSSSVASLRDVLEPRAIPTTSKRKLSGGEQRQNGTISRLALTSPSLPITPAFGGSTKPPALVTDFGDKQGIGPPGLSKLDITEFTLNTTLEDNDDDDDWGEMVKSPSAPSLPPTHPVPIPIGAEEIISTAGPDEHIPIIPSRRRPAPITVPITAPAAAQSSPDSMLSPARKAAFDAARATRFLNSQQTPTYSPTIQGSEVRLSGPRTPRFSPPPSPSAKATSIIPKLPSPSGSVRSDVEVVSGTIVARSIPEADVFFFETPAPQQNLSQGTKDAYTPVHLSTEEEEHAQKLVQSIPNLSFMLR